MSVLSSGLKSELGALFVICFISILFFTLRSHRVFFVYIVIQTQQHIGKYLLSNLSETSQHKIPTVYKDGLRF